MPRDPYIREKFTLEPMFLAFGLGPVSEGVEGMGNENSDAQNNQKCSNDFKHRRILRDLRAVKKIRSSGSNFPPLLDPQVAHPNATGTLIRCNRQSIARS
jgi:hypothetical protein